MTDIRIRKDARAGHITLTRPKALNALSYDMALAIETALDAWRDDDSVSLVLLDAEGDRAFCAGGDIAELYRTGRAGDFGFGRRFWRDEYRMNAKIANFPKPLVSFLHGFVMGGGVGIGCHGSHRVVGESARIALPECGIGLVPDVGGSFLLARAPGRLGEFIGLTGHRMNAGDAILAGFADSFVPEDRWEELKAELARSGDMARLEPACLPVQVAPLSNERSWIDTTFDSRDPAEILARMAGSDAPLARNAGDAITQASPLSMACTLEILQSLRTRPSSIEDALELEYRFTARAMELGDFLEGVRAAIVEKDRKPHWKHRLGSVGQDEIAAMLAPQPPQ